MGCRTVDSPEVVKKRSGSAIERVPFGLRFIHIDSNDVPCAPQRPLPHHQRPPPSIKTSHVSSNRGKYYIKLSKRQGLRIVLFWFGRQTEVPVEGLAVEGLA